MHISCLSEQPVSQLCALACGCHISCAQLVRHLQNYTSAQPAITSQHAFWILLQTAFPCVNSFFLISSARCNSVPPSHFPMQQSDSGRRLGITARESSSKEEDDEKLNLVGLKLLFTSYQREMNAHLPAATAVSSKDPVQSFSFILADSNTTNSSLPNHWKVNEEGNLHTD